MQFAEYKACRTADGVLGSLRDWLPRKVLTPEQAGSVERERIERLFAAPFGARILEAKKLRREFKVSILTDAGEYVQEAAGEQVMLQGVVDCFWEEPDGIVLVDFKTDRTPYGPEECAAHYARSCYAQSADKNLRLAGREKKILLSPATVRIISTARNRRARRSSFAVPVLRPPMSTLCGTDWPFRFLQGTVLAVRHKTTPRCIRFSDGLCLLSFGSNRSAARKPKTIAAVMPPAAAFSPPVSAPSSPSSETASRTPLERLYPKPGQMAVAPAPAKSTSFSYTPAPPRMTPSTTKQTGIRAGVSFVLSIRI